MKIIDTIKVHKRVSVVVTILVFGLITVGVVLLSKQDGAPEAPASQKFYSVLTGEEAAQDIAEGQIMAVMVENSPAARPQSGLDAAGIVFETTTEAGITRYLALYDKDYPEDIAPVRSVRPVFVNWLMSFDAAVAHVGGSAAALELLEQRDAKDLDQFQYPDPYYRGSDRAAPHNMHVRTADLLSLMQELGYTSSEVTRFARQQGAPVQQPDATAINISFSSSEYDTSYTYDPATNRYTRYLAGEPHIDAATGEPITVGTIVGLRMGRTIEAIGEGEAIVFQNGQAAIGRWRQGSYDQRTRLYQVVDGQEQEIALNIGDSWFAAVPSSGSIDY